MCVTICGRFCPDEGAVAGYGNRIRAKSPAKTLYKIFDTIHGEFYLVEVAQSAENYLHSSATT